MRPDITEHVTTRAATGQTHRSTRARRPALPALAALLLAVAGASAQEAAPWNRIQPSGQLSLPPKEPDQRVRNSTGFFVDGNGHLLTARHGVENCGRIIVSKERHRVAARLVALSDRMDLALLKIPRTLGLAAVFPRTETPKVNAMVFASAYRPLANTDMARSVLANARVISSFGGSEAGHLVIESPVTFGASGAPVLDSDGLVQGVISRRTMINRVLAVGAAETKSFLSSHGVRYQEDDRPQMSGSAPRASRAASLSAQVVCLPG